MKIIDLAPEFEHLYFCCLEEWSEDIREAGDHKACWYNNMKDKGLRVKIARDDNGVVGGMIQYLPVEESFAEGSNLYLVLCIWVHGHKQGIGNYQKKGMGKALLQAAEDDVRTLGAKGLAAWGVILPFFMRASWYKKQGYRVVDKSGIMRLLWKPFSSDATPPVFIKPKKKPELKTGKVNVSLFLNGWCTALNMVYERTLRAAAEFQEYTRVNDYRTTDKEVLREWGISDGIFVDRKEIRTGPPPSYKKIRGIIEKRVNRLKKASHN